MPIKMPRARVPWICAAVALLLIAGCTQRFGAYEIRLVPEKTPVVVYVVPAPVWRDAPCAIGASAASCAVLSQKKTYTLVRPQARTVIISDGNKVLVQSCDGRIARIDLVEPELGARNEFAVGC